MINMDDHELLVRIDERVERIDDRIDSHANRILMLEKFRSWCLGGLGVIGAAVAALKWWH